MLAAGLGLGLLSRCVAHGQVCSATGHGGRASHRGGERMTSIANRQETQSSAWARISDSHVGSDGRGSSDVEAGSMPKSASPSRLGHAD